MKIATSWLNEWLDKDLPDEALLRALERAGLEVEQFAASTPLHEKLLAVRVNRVLAHPSADRLHLVDVTTGSDEIRVVCGAPNVREGMMAALASVGAQLPSGDVITAAKLRGETSNGMLCSEQELGLGSDHNGILELPADVKPGTPLAELYPADGVIDLKTHANRFDLLSVVGLAREAAAMTAGELKPLSGPVEGAKPDEKMIAPGAESARFTLSRLSVKPGAKTPRWLEARLRLAGVRTISAIVDVTNYVNLELAQPLHAYDAAKVKLPLVVRRAKDGERLTTLDGVERKLTKLDLVIADQTGPIGLAGLMGGASTEVDEKTTEILLEAAVFDAATIRKMGQRHGLRTEASARFERGLPVESPLVGQARAIELLVKLVDAQLLGASDQLNTKPKATAIKLPLELANRLLGFAVTAKKVVAALGQLQIKAETSGDDITVGSVPWWRPDLKEAQDLVEELVRVLGYDRVPSKLPVWQPRSLQFDRTRGTRRLLQRVLYGAGLFEVATYSFVSEEQLTGLGLDPTQHLKLKNPLSMEQAYLRSELLASQLSVLARNRSYAKELGYYELSKVFIKQGAKEQPAEPERLAIMVVRSTEAYRQLKGIVDALGSELALQLGIEPTDEQGPYVAGRSAVVKLGSEAIGRIGQLDSELLRRHKVTSEAAYLELNVAPLLAAAGPRQFKAPSRYPLALRDLAVVIPNEVTWQAIAEALADLPATTISFVSDYYGDDLPAGHRSLALRLAVTHPDRTPTDGEVAAMEQKALSILQRKLSATARS